MQHETKTRVGIAALIYSMTNALVCADRLADRTTPTGALLAAMHETACASDGIRHV